MSILFITYWQPLANPLGSSAGSQLYMISWHLNLALTYPHPIPYP